MHVDVFEKSIVALLDVDQSRPVFCSDKVPNAWDSPPSRSISFKSTCSGASES